MEISLNDIIAQIAENPGAEEDMLYDVQTALQALETVVHALPALRPIERLLAQVEQQLQEIVDNA